MIYEVKKNHGEMFVDFLRSVNMGVVNRRKGKDSFTCVLGKGTQSWTIAIAWWELSISTVSTILEWYNDVRVYR